MEGRRRRTWVVLIMKMSGSYGWPNPSTVGLAGWGALLVVVSGVKLGRDYTKMLTQCFLQFQNVKIPIQHLWAILLFFHRSHWTNYIMSNRIYENVMSCQSHVKEKVPQIFLTCAGHSKLPNPTTRIPNSSSSSVRPSQKIRMAISRKRKELSEICWCENDRKNSEYSKQKI